jgi:dipeptidase E
MNTTTNHIFLAGGGNAEESRPLDEQFVRLLDHAKPLVYIPNAMRSKPYQACLEWFRSVMEPFGVVAIEMWDDLRPHRSTDEIAGVYIGGGDTAKLLQEIRTAGFDDYLREVVLKGIPLYGGSAGAIILGEDIRTAPEAGQLGEAEAAGLGIIKGYSIFCHYKAEDLESIVKLSDDLRKHVIAIPEKAGGCVTGGMFTNYGTKPVAIIRGGKVDMVNPNYSTEL